MMVPLFPTIANEDGVHSNPRPISIQKLVPNQASATHTHFKHLPAERLQSAARRAAADLQLEQTTRTLLQALNLQSEAASPSLRDTGRRRQHRPGPSHTDLDKTAHSDSEVSSISHRQNTEVCDSVQHIPTATTLLSEQATQTGGSAAGGRASGGQLPSLHLLRTLQSRLVAALQQVGQLRAQGPWQSRVLDQPDWDRKLARMDEFHAKITREMYILTRQVDLIMDSICSIPRTRVTSSLKGDVIRKLVRAHRSVLRVTQAFVQSYWDGSVDGRQAGRFLQLLSVCRSLTDVCQHLDIDTAPDMADLPERLAAMVRQHATAAGDVDSLIREMALGRFGPAAAAAMSERRRRQPRQPARPGSVGSRGHPASRQHHRAKSTADRLRTCRAGEKPSVRGAPAGRRVTGHPRAARPGSGHQAGHRVRPRRDHAALPPLPEERDSCRSEDGDRELPDHRTNYRDHPPRRHRGPDPVWSGRDQTDRGGDLLALTVEEAVRRALSGSAAIDPCRGSAQAPVPAQAGVPASVDRPGRQVREHQHYQDCRKWATNVRRGELTSRTEHQSDNTNSGDDREAGDIEASRDIEHNGEDGGGGDGGDSAETAGRRGDSGETAGRRGDSEEAVGRRGDRRDDEEPPGDRGGSLSGRGRRSDSRVRSREAEGARDGTRRGRSSRSRHRRREANGAVKSGADRTRRQLRHVLSRLEELQRERAVIRRRWAPLILARKRNEDDVIYLEVGADPEAGLGPATTAMSAMHQAGDSSTRPAVPSYLGGTTGGLPGRPPPHADAATSTSNLPAASPPAPPPLGQQLSGDQHRSVRDVFAAEALDPQLKSSLTEQLRGLLGNSDDSVIKSLPEETVNQLVDEFISEAGVDIFLHQLFDQEFEMR